MNLQTFEHEFRAMGSTIELSLVGGSAADGTDAARLIEELAAEWEHTFSRFDSTSELSRYNASQAREGWSERLTQAIEIALHGRDITAGLFDPTILRELVAAGYDRTFDEVIAPKSTPTQATDRCPPVEPERSAALDLGGIAKGMYADVVADTLAEFPGGLISAGGDLRVWGTDADGAAWTIGVEHPFQPEQDILDLVVSNAGVATSGTNRRAWTRAGERRHHLIDPRTGRPADSPLATITVVSSIATQAEIIATAMFIGFGCESLMAQLQPWFTLAVGIDQNAEVHVIDGLQEAQHATTIS